ncbi:unnamed protein product [Clonostachys rosea]|uniref:DUF7923 domain-containing protein n=1 Tax=Bionectria ochroleuca TaxID=29856 RepID=A0ABY6U836_BIOOC|nr:unnamed protein product [Clonostachys rosea]
MGADLEAYRRRVSDVSSGLAREVDQGLQLIQELLEKLGSTEAALTQTKLDLDNEVEARRRLQQEAKTNNEWKEQQERQSFVVALIDADADGYVFHNDYLRRGENGGEDAADALQEALAHYVRELGGIPDNAGIMVKAFANLGGLGRALVRDRVLQDAGQLREFASGFSNRKALFDFIDVGSGKERADHKIRENIKFFVDSSQCKHLVVACGHDAGYAPFLGQFVGNIHVADRITLLEGSPLPVVMKGLALKKTRFGSIFNEVQPMVRARPAGLSWSGVASANQPVDEVGGSSGPMLGYHNPNAQSDRFGHILRNESGRRIDAPLQVDKAIVERIKRGGLCFHLYLRGECIASMCRRNHAYRPLSNEEFDALLSVARRQGRCYQNKKADQGGSDCSDPKCVYGHWSSNHSEDTKAVPAR